MPVLLMTRPQAAAEGFTAALPDALRARLTILYSPLLDIRPLPGPLEAGDARGLIFTSANGVAAAAALPRGLPAYCVGEATAGAAAAAGWRAEACGGTADALVDRLLETRPDGPLLHLRGAHTRGDVAARLTAGGLPCAGKAVYEQMLLPLTGEAEAALKAQAPVIAPLFSPRSARQFSKICPAEARPILLALRPAVADPMKSLNYKGLQICKMPTAQAMAKAVQDAAGRLARVEGGQDPQ
mgnify:FL=1